MKNKHIISDPEEMTKLITLTNAIVRIHLGHVSEQQLTPEAELIRDLGADSLDCELIALDLEEAFSIEVEEAKIDMLKTLGDVYQYVASKIEETA